jgi:8-oxo-dGTP diphosphatase
VITVVAALIERDGKLLVCQRRRGGTLELMWEFPGGKIQPGESLEAALARELREELGVHSRIGPEVHRARHQYAEMSEPIELVFFVAEVVPAEIRNQVFERIEWRQPETLPELDFLPADRDLIDLLASGALRLPRSEGSLEADRSS